MRFGPVPLAEAEGAVLAHSVALPDGRLRKGARLGRAELDALHAAGQDVVTVARLEPGDVDEDTAAARLAAALVPDPVAAGLRIGPAATGRANLFAEAPGIVEVAAPAIHGANAVDPMITIATVPEWQRMETGGMVATVKIIAYAVGEAALSQACAAARGALRLRRAVHRKARLIQTTVRADETGQKGQAVTETRLSRLGVDLAPICTVPHSVPALARALSAADEDILLILTGSATSDSRDVAPEAVRAAGGRVIHFGMPVDPGNLLFVGALGGRPVVGLPGCARAPALNGADWVLERLICGVDVGPAEIARMGVGGLLKEIPQRGRLRQP